MVDVTEEIVGALELALEARRAGDGELELLALQKVELIRAAFPLEVLKTVKALRGTLDD